MYVDDGGVCRRHRKKPKKPSKMLEKLEKAWIRVLNLEPNVSLV